MGETAAGQVASEVAIDVFGGLTVRWGNVERPIGGPRQRRLLATLIVERDRVVSTARLAEAVWRSEDLPQAADRTLQTYISRLRNTLGEHAVAREHGGYRLKGSTVAVSSDRFIDAVRAAHSARSGPAESWLTAVDAALALWRGQPYGDLAAEPFLVGEVNRLAELHQAMAEDRVEALAASGRHAEALGEAERLLSESPLRERPYRLMMTELHQAGRSSEALRCFQRYRALLASETGLEPGSGLQELELAILAGHVVGHDEATPGRLADFRLGELLGGDRTATVHRAVHLATGRELALKVLRREALRDPVEIHRFDLECEILAQIEHPHVVPLYDAWRDSDCAWIATRLLRCGTVADALIGEPWPIAEIAVLIDRVAAALDAMHRAGVVHGDVGAGKVMFDEARRAYLVGFGKASRVGTDVHEVGAVDVAGLVHLAASCLVGQVLAADADPSLSIRPKRRREDFPTPFARQRRVSGDPPLRIATRSRRSGHFAKQTQPTSSAAMRSSPRRSRLCNSTDWSRS